MGAAVTQVPALIQFEGHPEVSETGDLVYVFPGLQRTARQKVGAISSWLTLAHAEQLMHDCQGLHDPSLYGGPCKILSCMCMSGHSQSPSAFIQGL